MNNKDLETIENFVRRYTDDIAVSIARSFERLEERIDAGESRLSMRLTELEEREENSRADIQEWIGDLSREVEFVRSFEQAGKAPEKVEEEKHICSCGNEHMTPKIS